MRSALHAVLAGLAASHVTTAPAAAASVKPNFIFVLADVTMHKPAIFPTPAAGLTLTLCCTLPLVGVSIGQERGC